MTSPSTRTRREKDRKRLRHHHAGHESAHVQDDAPTTRPSFNELSYRAAGLLILIAIWELAAAQIGNPRQMPRPWAVFGVLIDLVADGSFLSHTLLSIRRVFLGFFLAIVIATGVGVLLARSKTFERLFGIYVFIGLTVPGLAYAIVAIIFFGINETAAIAAVVATILPLLILNIWEGTKAVDGNLIQMSVVFGSSRRSVWRHVIIPSLTPYLFASTRLGLSLAWKLVVVVELIGLSSGVGFAINTAYSQYSMVRVLAWTLGFSLIMATLEFGIVRRIESYILRWRTPAH